MRVVIAGSRTITNKETVFKAIAQSDFDITEVVSGGALGVDQLGEQYAVEHDIPINRFLPEWRRYGKSAGMLRNTAMIAYADAAIIIWNGSSRGSADTISKARRKGIPTFIAVVVSNYNVTC